MKKLFIILLIVNCSFPIVQTQWVQQTLPVNKPITGIKFVDSLKGWACTSTGTPADTGYILSTTNSGTNWFVQLSAYNLNYTDINMLNSLTGYVSGADNNILLYKLFKTTNGGINWTFTTMVPNMYIGDMQFLNQDSAWECGSSIGPDVRTTTDGGNSWIVRTNGITQATQKIFFLNYNTGFCGAGTYLYKTTNAGMSWGLKGNFSPETVASIYFLNENTGWLAMTGNQIKYTTNGGINWATQVPESIGSGTIWSIFFINSFTGWAGTGSFPKIYKTTNSGLNWGYQLDTGRSNTICFIDSLNGWSAGTSSVLGIYHTTNGGGTIIYTGFVSNGTAIPREFILYQNFPNPFNPITTIKLDLPASANISLVICDMLGRELYRVAKEFLKAGSYNFSWDARKFSSGIYFYRMTTEDFSETKRMVLIK
jgi:Secretion system C-terminal sorting domain